MQKGRIALFLLLFSLTVPLGCGGQTIRQARLEAEQPKAGGTLVLGVLHQPATLNPVLSSDAISRSYLDTMFDGLLTVNDRLEMVPELAESYHVSPDGLSWTFKLRQGVQFHDGEELTSEDVKFTYDTIMKDKNAKVAKTDYVNVTAIDTPDRYSVKFTLSEKSASFPSKLNVGVVPKRLLVDQDLSTAEFNRQPVGTGPFVFEEWTPGQRISVRANEEYFKGRPKLDRLVWKMLPDGNAQNAQLLSGEIDGSSLGPRGLEQVQKVGQYAIYDSLGGNSFIGFQNEHPLFQDKRVRQALNYGLDKQAIIENIMLGSAVQATSNLVPSSWAYNPNLNRFPYDKQMAKKMLAEAGWRPGSDGILTKDGRRFKFTLLASGGSKQREQIALFARQQWSESGIEVDVQFMELNAFINERVLKSNFDAIFLSGSVSVDPEYLNRSYHSKAIPTGHNFLRYSSPEVDKLLGEGRTALELSARKQIYFKVQELVNDDSPQISIYYPKSYTAMNSSLHGIKPNPWNLYWNVEEWHYEGEKGKR